MRSERKKKKLWGALKTKIIDSKNRIREKKREKFNNIPSAALSFCPSLCIDLKHTKESVHVAANYPPPAPSLPLSGAYLVPYLILLIVIGIPLFFLELAVGQRIRRGSIGVWNYVYPRLGGIGVSSLMVSGLCRLTWPPIHTQFTCDKQWLHWCLSRLTCNHVSGSVRTYWRQQHLLRNVSACRVDAGHKYCDWCVGDSFCAFTLSPQFLNLSVRD